MHMACVEEHPAAERECVASDGYRLNYRVWEPEGEPRADVVLLNGIMSNSAWFGPLVPGLTANGLRLIGADRRGSGHNKAGWGDAPSAQQLLADVQSIATGERGDRPWLLIGWCWGAGLAIGVAHAAHKAKDAPAGLILVTPGLFMTEAVQTALAEQMPRLQTSAPDELCIASPIREEWFTSGPDLERCIRSDPHRVQTMTPRMVEVSAKLSTAAVARLRTLPMPILLLLADDDSATDNDATLRAFERRPTDRWTHAMVPAKHGVQFDAPDVVIQHVRAFVEPLLRL